MRVLDAFQYLRDGLGSVGGQQLLIRSTGIRVESGDVLLGLEPSGIPHILIPSNQPVDDRHSGAVHMGARSYVEHGLEALWLDVWCSEPALTGVFERFAEDVCERLHDASAPEGAVIDAFDEWKALLKPAPGGLTRQQTVGLVGELEVLRRIAAKHPARSIEMWTGPKNSVHDFMSSTQSLEVKTTEARSGGTITVNSLEQLDVGELDLHLAVLRLQEHPGGVTLDDQIEALLRLGVPRLALYERLELVGYSDGDPWASRTFRVTAPSLWPVCEEFPRLRKQDLPPNVLHALSGLTYGLALGALGTPLPSTIADSYFDRFGSTP